MKASIQDFKELVNIGQTVDIATSEYSIEPNKTRGWNPVLRMNYQTVKSMEKQGLIEAKYFWRGCTVKRIK